MIDGRETEDGVSEYYDLGSHFMTINTSSHEAQLWFDRDLVWCYGYHHEEAIACFERALKADPDCAMARWASPMHWVRTTNKPWPLFDPSDKAQSLGRAHAETQTVLALL